MRAKSAKCCDEGTAALIVIGVDKDTERVEKAASKAIKYATKRVSGDADEAEHEAIAAMASA